MFPVRLPDGKIAGFIGRKGLHAGKDSPKYLNSRQTPLYRKGAILFGLHEGLPALRQGARPVIIEGPLDAIAVTAAGSGKYVGVAPCGTALTADQVQALARETDLAKVGIVVAFDGDSAGQRAAVKAFNLLRDWTEELWVVAIPPGQDPAGILAEDGPAALAAVLDDVHPLADLVVDSVIVRHDRWLEFIEGKFNALAAVAPVIASLPVGQVARQVKRVAERLELSHAEVTAKVSDAIGELLEVAGSTCAVSSRPASAPHGPDRRTSPHTAARPLGRRAG